MAVTELVKNVYSVGAVHWDRKFFDEVIPLPHGTSYNSYIIKGSEKTALIDTVDPETFGQLEENLKELNITKIDYIISNHAEQDHSGSIPHMLLKHPDAKVVTNEKCKSFLKELLLIADEKFITVKDNSTLPLGDKTLQFVLTPWVHWPETMSTYLQEDKILFSCDFFGSHIATSDIFNDRDYYEGAKRYFAEIMYPFRNNVLGNLNKIGHLEIGMIAPSHGIIYKNPKNIIEAYKEWSEETVKNEALFVYVSMHESTKKMADHLLDGLIKRGVQVRFFNLMKADVGEIAISLVDAATIIIGSPNFLAGAHPAAASAVFLVNALRPKAKYASLVISYNWAEKASEQIKGMLTNFKGEIIAPVIVKGFPKEADLKELDRLADEIARKHKEDGLF
jgi:flavorubredoxin